MFDNKNSESSENEHAALSGCGKLDEKTADALLDELRTIESVPDYFLKGVMAGLYFIAIESGEMGGKSIEEYVTNAHTGFIDSYAHSLVDSMTMNAIGIGGMTIKVRHV